MPSPPSSTSRPRPGPNRRRRLALSLLVASVLVFAPQASAIQQDPTLGSGEYVATDGPSSPARPVRLPAPAAAADVRPSIPLVQPSPVSSLPETTPAQISSSPSSSSGRRLSSAASSSGTVDDEPASLSRAIISSADDSASVNARRRSHSSAMGDGQTVRQRQSTHRRLARRQQDAEPERTAFGEESATEGNTVQPSTPTDTPSATTFEASTTDALAETVAAASSSSSAAMESEGSAAGEPSSSNKASGGGRPIPTLSGGMPVPDPFPKPFDTTLSLNFTAPCLKFFGQFLTDPTYIDCRPLSFLLPSSAAFAKLTRAADLEPLAAVVQASLEPTGGAATCSSAMEALGVQMAKQCSADLKSGNALASQALTGFETYSLVHNASSLVDDDGTNCFLSATSAAGADESYYWGLWQGQTLPPSTKPTCSPCSKALMATYAGSGLAAKSATALSAVYGRAVNLTNAACGPGWATLVVVQPEQSAAAVTARPSQHGWSTPVSVGPWALALAMIAASLT